MAETHLQGTDVIIEAAQPQIGSAAKESLSSIVNKINSNSQATVRLEANVPANTILNIGPAVVTLHDGGQRSLPPLNNNEITYAGGTIDFGTGTVTGGGANLTLPTMTASFFVKALVELTETNVIAVTFGPENVASSGATVPNTTTGRVPLGVLTLQDNGTGGQGSFSNVSQANIQSFELGGGSSGPQDHNLQLNLQGGQTNEFFHLTTIQHSQVTGLVNSGGILTAGSVSTSGTVKTVDLAAGMFYVEGNIKIDVPLTTVNLDAGFVTGSDFNVVLISLDMSGTLITTPGIANAVQGSVIPPTFPIETLPLALISIHGDGLGSIDALITTDIEDVRPVYNMGRGHTFNKLVSFAKGANISSAASLVLGSDGNYFDVTGTTDISSISSVKIGTQIKLHFVGALTLINDGVGGIIQVPGGNNLALNPGDEAEFIEYQVGKWRLVNHQSPAASLPSASETQPGVVELATAAETTTGTDGVRAVHPAALKVELDKKTNLATLTAKGDLYIRDAVGLTRLPAGTNGQQLQADSVDPLGLKWASPGAPSIASEILQGIVELATALETQTGTDNTRAVHPAGLKSILDLQTPGIGNNQQDVTANLIVTSTDFNKTFTNLGALATVTFTLPNVTSVFGKTFTFVKLVVQDIIVQAAGTDIIGSSVAGGTITNNTATETFAFIRLSSVQTGITTGVWIPSSGFGTWTIV